MHGITAASFRDLPSEIRPGQSRFIGKMPQASFSVDQQVQRGRDQMRHIGRRHEQVLGSDEMPALRQRSNHLGRDVDVVIKKSSGKAGKVRLDIRG